MSNSFLIFTVNSQVLDFYSNNTRVREVFNALTAGGVDFACISQVTNRWKRPAFFMNTSFENKEFVKDITSLYSGGSFVEVSKEDLKYITPMEECSGDDYVIIPQAGRDVCFLIDGKL